MRHARGERGMIGLAAAVASVVIGGTIITGGFGYVLGSVLGSLVLTIVSSIVGAIIDQ